MIFRFLLAKRLILIGLLLCTAAIAEPAIAPFENVGTGLEYRLVTLSSPRPLVVHQLRCDPKKVRFSLLLASDRKGKSVGQVSRVKEMGEEFPVLALLNSSYFGHSYELLGYTERAGEVLESRVATGGVFSAFFYWDGGRAGLKKRGESLPKNVPVLFQAGPRLVWDGEPIQGLEKQALAARSGVSLDDQGRVTLFAIGGTSFTTLAELPSLLMAPVSKGGLASVRALNFDGGSSTQFLLNTQRKKVHLPAFSPVPIFLAVSAK